MTWTIARHGHFTLSSLFLLAQRREKLEKSLHPRYVRAYRAALVTANRKNVIDGRRLPRHRALKEGGFSVAIVGQTFGTCKSMFLAVGQSSRNLPFWRRKGMTTIEQ